MADDDLSTHWEETEGQTAKDAAAATDQHFWADADGAHVSSTGDHDLSGLNLLLTSAKLAFRKVLAELLTIDAVNGVISFLGGAVTIRGVEWHRGGTDYAGVGMHSTQDGVEMSCDSSWEGEPARVAVGRTGPAGETGGCVYLEGQRIFAKDPSLAVDGANASMTALWALLVGIDEHIVAGESVVTLEKRIADAIQPVMLYNGGANLNYDVAPGAGTTGAVTLSEDASHFKEILLYLNDNNGRTVGVFTVAALPGAKTVANGQTADCFGFEAADAANTWTFIRRTRYTVTNGTTLVPSNGGWVSFRSGDGVGYSNDGVNYLRVYRVTGRR